MADKPTPTPTELKAMWQLHAADIGGIFHYARAVLAKCGQPSGATEEVENLRKALVYVAFALHATPQYMLAQGITLIDGDTVRVSRDGWTVEASVNPHRQPAPATQQGAAYAALPTSSYAGRVYEEGFLIGTCPLYTADKLRAFADATCALRASHGQAPAEAAQAADSVQEDAARYRFLRDGEWRDTDLEPFIRLQLNTLWDAKIDAARAAQEGASDALPL